MELSSPQCLLLALLSSLVNGDVMSCVLLADVCPQLPQLRSRYLKIWLMEDFVFPNQDIQKSMALLTELLASGVMKLPSHVIRIMSSLAMKYGVTTAQLTSSMKVYISFTHLSQYTYINNKHTFSIHIYLVYPYKNLHEVNISGKQFICINYTLICITIYRYQKKKKRYSTDTFQRFFLKVKFYLMSN